jgi:farnesyl-diphosphate farnesyltransferase
MSQDQPGSSPRSELAWCYDAVEDVSRTFALTVAELDEPMSREICVGYLLCRIADTVEDAGHVPGAAKRELLERYRRALDPASETTMASFREAVEEWTPAEPDEDWAVVGEAPRVARVFAGFDRHSRDAVRPHVLELVDGMATFVDRYADRGGLRLATVAELEEYCWYAAGTVGTLVTDLLADDAAPAEREQMEANARSFALLLQLVNVAKDVAVDYEEENNVYLPRELLADHDLETEAIGDRENGAAFAPAIRQVVERAEGYLDGAQAWLDAMPTTRGNSLSAWAVPFLLAVGTIRELERRPEDVVGAGGVKVARAEVHAVLDAFAGETTPAVADLREKIRRRPLHEY